MLGRIGTVYARQFDPTNGALNVLGDFLAQTIAGDSLDSRRLCFFAFFGCALGPFIAWWNRQLSLRFPLHPLALSRSPHLGSQKLKLDDGLDMTKRNGEALTPRAELARPVSSIAVFKRTLADQLIFAPIALVLFLFTSALAFGLDWRDRIASLFIPLLLANWSIWPFVQLVNFRCVPWAAPSRSDAQLRRRTVSSAFLLDFQRRLDRVRVFYVFEIAVTRLLYIVSRCVIYSMSHPLSDIRRSLSASAARPDRDAP